MNAPTEAATAAPTDRPDAFELLDRISQAKVDLLGTVAIALEIIEANADDGVSARLHRLVETDTDALNEAFSAAWDGLVKGRKGDAT